MNIAISINRKYVLYACVMLTSVCVNNREEHIDAWVLNHELTEEDLRLLRDTLAVYDTCVIDCKVSLSEFDGQLPTNSNWTEEIYYRLLLSESLPRDIDRILYLDTDIIVHQSLSQLYHQELCDYELLAAEDVHGTLTEDQMMPKQREMFSPFYPQGFHYFNSGVVLFHLVKIREKYSFHSYLSVMEKWGFAMAAPDQDILNYVHWEHAGYIPWERYNLFARLAHQAGVTYDEVKQSAVTVHFVGAKPWQSEHTHFGIEQLWWDYARLTPKSVYYPLLEKFQLDTVNNPTLDQMFNRLIENSQRLVELTRKLSGESGNS